MIKNWLKDIKEERPLWLAECRQEAFDNENAKRISIDVITALGENRSFDLALPLVESAEEIALMSKYLDANRVNAAMLLGQLDDTDCAMPPASAILKQMKETEDEAAAESVVIPGDKLICSIVIGGNDIKLLLAQGEDVRRLLAYDWNPDIATEDAMIINPVVELAELVHNAYGDFDALCVVRATGFDKYDFESGLKAFVKEGGTIKSAGLGNISAFCIYNELAGSDAKAMLSDGIYVINIDKEPELGFADAKGNITDYPLKLSECILRFDVEEGRFMNQKALLAAANMPDSNPKPCLDLLAQMAEGGDSNTDTLFRDYGNYLGHAVREILHYMGPQPNKFILMGQLFESDYVFDLTALGMQTVASDADVIQIDEGLAYSPLMKKLAANEATPLAEFAPLVGAAYYADK